jgi:hypothetical protein
LKTRTSVEMDDWVQQIRDVIAQWSGDAGTHADVGTVTVPQAGGGSGGDSDSGGLVKGGDSHGKLL